VRRNTLSFRLRAPLRKRLAVVRVSVDGRLVRRVTGDQLDRAVRLTGLPNRSFLLELRARTTGGERLWTGRIYRACRG
jgi:hypothetical protein